MRPLSDILRPEHLEQVVGQKHLLSEGCLLRNIIESNEIPNMIFYGPSGCGKTTIAKIIAKNSSKKLYQLNATTASLSDIKEIIKDINPFTSPNGILLYLDEIQYFNKRQQQSLLEFIENGSITLIASTTENPYFYIYNAILSRCTVFEFQPVAPNDIIPYVDRALSYMSERMGFMIGCSDEVKEYICTACGGDVRKAANSIEILSAGLSPENAQISPELVQQATQKSALRYDRDGDSHYDILSAFQKSIRGSDENAALHYLARLIEANDLPSICRRLQVVASEDVGLAYPMAAVITKSCIDAALMLGFPEARIPLAQAVILLSTAPKSNSVITAIDEALSDVKSGRAYSIPASLQDAHYSGSQKLGHGQSYLYSHNFPHHYVKQQFLPDELCDRVYYHYGDNKIESTTRAYWQKIKESLDEK